MQVTFSGKSVHITDREREYAARKLQRLARYFRTAREAHLVHSVQRNWQIVEVQVDLDGLMLRAEERNPDIIACIDAVSEKLEQQVRRLKGKITARKGKADAPTVATALADTLEPSEQVAAPEEETPLIIRRKRFTLKPMSPEEATLQMDLLHHDFFAYLDADSQQVNVLYRRRDGNYGLLELET